MPLRSFRNLPMLMEKYHHITICALKSSHLQARHKKWSRPATAHKGAEEIGVRAKIGENANFFGFQRSMLIQLIHFCFSTLQYGCFNPHRQWLNIDIESPSNRNISSILLKVHIFYSFSKCPSLQESTCKKWNGTFPASNYDSYCISCPSSKKLS